MNQGDLIRSEDVKPLGRRSLYRAGCGVMELNSPLPAIGTATSRLLWRFNAPFKREGVVGSDGTHAPTREKSNRGAQQAGRKRP